MVANLGVVRDVYAFVNEVAVADASRPVGFGGAVDHHILANHVVVADQQERIASLIIEVLRLGSDYGSVIHLVAASHACPTHHTGVRHDLAIVANLNILIDVGEGMNDYVFP